MKKQLTNAINKKVFTLLVVLATLGVVSEKSYALPDKPVAVSKAAEISYKGLQDKMLVFKVDYKNESAEPFQLMIRNDQNEVLFFKRYDAVALSTNVYLSELPENCKLTFSIKTNKKDINQSFEINSKIKTVEEYIVKGL